MVSNSWSKLSILNVNDHTEKKGQFTYLSWAWAWNTVKELYPTANFKLLDDIIYADGTMEVRVEVTIEEMSHTAFLPVLDFKNKPISKPNAFDINSARMRCLVKALAFHGLGLYIYAGEDIPSAPALSEELSETLTSLVANGDPIAFMTAWSGLDEQIRSDYFNSAPQGHKVKFKESVKSIEATFHAMADDYEGQIAEAVTNGDKDQLKQLIEELSGEDLLKKSVWSRLGPVLQQSVKAALA
tara:strand:- start:873 stop:1598 length:726 start_codon:yes stop_codon:yes gene_type:complete